MDVTDVKVDCAPDNGKVATLLLASPLVAFGAVDKNLKRGKILLCEEPYNEGNHYLIHSNQCGYFFRINELVLLRDFFVDVQNPTQEEKDNFSMLYPFANLEDFYAN